MSNNYSAIVLGAQLEGYGKIYICWDDHTQSLRATLLEKRSTTERLQEAKPHLCWHGHWFSWAPWMMEWVTIKEQLAWLQRATKQQIIDFLEKEVGTLTNVEIDLEESQCRHY